jgi:MFS family permease
VPVSFFREFRINWVTLLATFIGIASGNALSHYTLSLFAPELIAEFGWSKAQFALTGVLQAISVLTIPIAGWFTDRFGARIAVTIGFAAISIGFLAYTVMDGSLLMFFAIWISQHLLGVLTTSLVFTRVVVERFDHARGTSLSLLMMGPPLSGAIAAPILGSIIAADGWRAGFGALAIASAIGGTICVVMMGRKKHEAPTKQPKVPLTRAELMTIIRTRTFCLLVGGMALINLPQVFAASQIKLVVMAGGVSDRLATWMVSFYAIGVILGRAIFGIALDRIGAHLVALFALSLPAVGYVVLASPDMLPWVVAGGVLIVGIAQGAEGDIGAYMVSRHFDLKNYSTILGFVRAGLDGGGAVGALILSMTLAATNSYGPFLYMAAAASVLGAICFFVVGPGRRPAAPTEPSSAMAAEAV